MRRLIGPVALALLLPLAACGEEDGVGTTIDFTRLEDIELTRHLGCGHGFAVTDRLEHHRLDVFHRGDRSGPLPRTVRLPDPEWEAELLVGDDLAANWCNDVILEPEAEVRATWRVVAATLTFVGGVPPLDQTSGTPLEARAELAGVVVEHVDGERVELGDVPLHNEMWGFYAG